MAMAVLSRATEAVSGALLIWVFVGLVSAADFARRLTPPSASGSASPGWGEVSKRALLLAVAVAAAVVWAWPVEWAARSVQKSLLGWLVYGLHEVWHGGGDLRLNLPTPLDFGRRMRIVLLVDADHRPAYLRERTYMLYAGGRWQPVKPERELRSAAGRFGFPAQEKAYALGKPDGTETGAVWRVEILAPELLTALCLPGSAVALACVGDPPITETNGTVATEYPLAGYSLLVRSRLSPERAYPFPDGSGSPDYLDVPASLVPSVSNWVAECSGLTHAPSVPAAVRATENYFSEHFTYRLGVSLNAAPDPLVDFMARKEGSCTHFASAAALMFRSCGIPSRVVGGFLCDEWSPWLKWWVVRERQEHAWVEVWDAAAGRWRLADPTPPSGNPSALEKPTSLRQLADLFVAGWKRLLVYLGNTDVLQIIGDAGTVLVTFLWRTVCSLPGVAVLLAVAAVVGLRHRKRRLAVPPAERLRNTLAREAERWARRQVESHLQRRQAETWGDWLDRVRPELPEGRFSDLQRVLERYQELRYQTTLNESAARAWLSDVRQHVSES